MSVRVIEGDALTVLETLDAQSVQCCVTSPPYLGLRDYGVEGQVGAEDSLDKYVARLVAVFDRVYRVLRNDGTLWLNLGDTYTEKELTGIPWRVAFALQEECWYLRSDIVWSKPNPMPESVTDRPTKSHEYLFLLTKSPTYYYDSYAIQEPTSPNTHDASKADPGWKARTTGNHSGPLGIPNASGRRNARSVWTISPQKYSGAHFATFPPKLIEPCILAGSRKDDTVLDPFGGAGTTGLVADRLGRSAILIELNPAYVALSRKRISADSPLFGDVA